MDWASAGLAALEFLAHEMALAAASGFVLLGIGDLGIDFVWMVRWLGLSRQPRQAIDAASEPAEPGRLAIFIPAWDEAAVIGRMLARSLAVIDHSDYRIYVGCYPNDPATIETVRSVRDDRVRLVIGPRPGPTSKADCLNALWDRMEADEKAEGRRFKAIILHDAEDIVHPDGLRILDRLSGQYWLVQLPVIPMIHPASLWISGHYADEFAEAHGKEMVVRCALDAGLPSAGVGCAFSREALAMVAEREGQPFDADSLTEDYELGLRIKALGGRQIFVRAFDTDGALIATREYFPSDLDAAIRQKGRWMAGIALAGWDRLGWGGSASDHWMRARDRQSLLAACLLFCGYASIALWLTLGLAGTAVAWDSFEQDGALLIVLQLNLALLCWRITMRMAFVTNAYGWRQGLIAVPRILVGNLIAIFAAMDALARYSTIRRCGRSEWGKTAHAFPPDLPA